MGHTNGDLSINFRPFIYFLKTLLINRRPFEPSNKFNPKRGRRPTIGNYSSRAHRISPVSRVELLDWLVQTQYSILRLARMHYRHIVFQKYGIC